MILPALICGNFSQFNFLSYICIFPYFSFCFSRAFLTWISGLGDPRFSTINKVTITIIIIKRVKSLRNTGSKANITLYLEQFADFVCQFFLMLIKNNWVAYFFSLTIPFNFSIQWGRLACFRMGVFWAHCVHLHTITRKSAEIICTIGISTSSVGHCHYTPTHHTVVNSHLRYSWRQNWSLWMLLRTLKIIANDTSKYFSHQKSFSYNYFNLTNKF